MLKNDDNPKIGVVGAGSWGTALANLLAQKGFPVDLWVFEKEVEEQIRGRRENEVFLPGIRLSDNLAPSNDIARVAADKDFLITVVPSHLVRTVAGEMAPHVSPDTVVVSASKGIENQTHLTMTQVLGEMMPVLPPENITVLSGPSFAREVVANVPTAVTVAGRDAEAAVRVQHIFATPYFRVYTSDDTVGVELGGAVKNVIAIAAGIIDGLNLGLNTRAALITRGQTEIRRLGLELGANPRTFTGLAGIGDLILTCTGDLSRNHTVGKQIGRGKSLKTILSEMRMVAEGVKTSKSVYNLARKLKVEMPISSEIYQVLYHDVPPKEAVFRLMTRDLKEELDKK
ncbi:MAG: NAD(P)H-dependent glycerol-3-phosphate dehydrogenase [Thermodesulfobacteriota bacterium]